ncbi:PH domain-containing protein [Nocardioides limicola]|uniref:PH domain-containing protein n=1 Tax=Nocardioides limicola TaxID=2803368 RepID=UPI00193B1BC1|nr:PH domain-containing protein [Nocardioides sp. DJM-14]
MGLARAITDPQVGRHLLRDEGEVIVDEVRHHWIAFVPSTGIVLVAVAMFAGTPFLPVDLAWFPILVSFAVLLIGCYRWLYVWTDRFVITNMRVFRVHGVLARQHATMPLARILDITVRKPVLGRILGYGHFIFESAAQEQGLRDIRFIGRPYQRDLAIQRVVQRAGLRGPRVN